MSGHDLTAVSRRAAPTALLRSASLALATSALAAASHAQPVTISGPSPFGAIGACGNFPGEVAGVGTAFVDSEVEPFLAINPTDPDNLIAVYQQDRWSNGGARGNVASFSLNGGTSWAAVPLPNLTDCTDGPWERASDPWVTFSPNGHAFAMSLVFQTDPPASRPGGFGENAMVVQKSTDGGMTWSDPTELVRDVNPRVLHDKNSITADPTDSNFVYAVWDRLSVPTGVAINPENLFGLGFKGPVTFARTTDGGASWERARIIYDPGGNNQTIGNQIVVHPDGTVLDFFNEILNFRNDDGGTQFDFNLSIIRSFDKGATWLPRGRPQRVQKLRTRALFPPFVGVFLPDTPDNPATPEIENAVRTGDVLFDVAVDPTNGNLYAVWQDARFTTPPIDQIAFSQSTDGGFTWSAPIKVNQTPLLSNILRSQAFTPSVDVTGDGTVFVTYYDFRNDDNTGELADYFGVSCTSGCSSPSGFSSSEVPLSAASFDITDAPFARGFFTGDYEGLASDANGSGAANDEGLAAWSQPNGGDPGDILFERY
jgi:hypothetical protein